MDGSDRPMNIHQKALECIDNGRPFAVALVLDAEGSTPQVRGARAVIEADGRIWGTVGGGVVEAEAQRRAIEACRSKRPVVFDVHLDGAGADESGAICGGTMQVLIDPTAAKARACYAQAAEAIRQRRRGALLTAVRVGPEVEVVVRWHPEEGDPSEIAFPGCEAVRTCLARETPRLFRQAVQQPQTGIAVLVEPVFPQPLLLIVGGGHIGQALARQAVPIGFDVTVLDDRPEFARRDLFPAAATARCGDISREVAAFPMTRDTYVVIVTRGHRHDVEALAASIRAPVAYIGMIGSKRKVALVRQSFIRSALATEGELRRVFAPIGLDIGAVTVPEIAASIVAQLVAVRRKGSAAPVGHMVLP